MGLRDDILARADLAAAVAAKDCAAIAAAVSVGRTRYVPTEIGNGTVLEVLGLPVGNALLDLIAADTSFRHVRPLLEQGRLRVDSALVIVTLGALVGMEIAAGVTFTAAHRDALLAIASAPDPVSAADVADALYHPDGSLK